jgi:hypothetical protein
VAVKVAAVAPAATVTDAGMVSQALFLVSVTFDPPVGAAVLKVTVHVLTPLGLRLVGLQVSAERRPGATRAMATLCVLLPRLAVMVGF